MRPLLPPCTLFALPAVAALAAACGGSPSSGPAPPPTPVDPLPYLDDAVYRRVSLVASIVNPDNEYSSLRLAHYDTGNAADWSRLPEWNPAVEVIAASELDVDGGAQTATLSPSAAALTFPPSVTSLDDPALLALGEAAFNRYPVQPTPYFSAALPSRQAASEYGLWVDDLRGAGGLVRAKMGDGSVALADTCSTCHASHDGNGAWVAGRPNSSLQVGAAILATEGSLFDSSTADAIALWGAGRLDVTTNTGL